ncbi:Retrovirus-related Pol polyprotein from transposon TNT 1-94-like protein [Drosera capensis]
MYAMVCTRPDIAHAVGVVSRFLSNPGKQHWEAVKWILRYLKGTSKLCLSFGKGELVLEGYTDADMAGDLDHRKSTSGYVFTFAGGAVSWQSKLQKCVALSTTEAEYIAATEAGKELLWLTRFLLELGMQQEEMVVFCDSQSAIDLSKNDVYHSRTKHIDVRFHWLRDAIEKQKMKLKKIHKDKNPSDIVKSRVQVFFSSIIVELAVCDKQNKKGEVSAAPLLVLGGEQFRCKFTEAKPYRGQALQRRSLIEAKLSRGEVYRGKAFQRRSLTEAKLFGGEAFRAEASVFFHSLAQGRHYVSVKLAKAPDGTVRTFEGDDGDVIDCVVFHKQPAFKHPRLHNHKIQMEPSSYPNVLRQSNQITNELMQPWHAKGECPAGTVPIKRPLSNSPKTKRRDHDRIDTINEVLNPHQYAVVHYPGFNGSIHGTSGTYSVWNPWVARGEDYSVAQIWVIAGTGDDLNTIEAWTRGAQTMTQMGSGHIASKGFGKASYISGLTIRTSDSTELATGVLHKTVTAPSCYSLQQSDDAVYFGGPGCPFG